MDAGQRCCTVSVTNGSRVTLSIHFPAMYPNNAIPGFVFTPDTAIPMSTQSRLIKTLQETAYNHVKLNQTCLEPCLRQLVSQLEELTLQEERVTDVSQAIPQILPVTYGSYQDAAIPFPRTSGAKFSACGLLVCFHRPNASNEPTPRSLSALSAYSYRPSPGPALPPLHNNTGNLKASHPRTFASFGRMGGHSRQRYFRSLSQEDRMSKKFGSMSAPAPRNRGGLVMIWDVSVLMPLHRSLAQNYVLEGNDVIDICKKNTSAALAVGRKDLVQTWSLLGLVLERKLAQAPDNVDDTPWALHPFGRPLLDFLMEYYLNIRDIQTLAVLTCVMSHHSLPDSFKPAKHQGHLITSKSFTFGSTMGPSPTFMYETSHQPGPKRSKSVANSSVGLTGEGSTPEMVWCDILPHDSWTPPEFINKRDAMEEQRKQHDNNCRLLVQSKVLLHDHFKRVYADVLYRWNLLSKRAEVLKFLSKPPDPHKDVEFSTRCYNCLQRTRGAQCMSCKSIGLQCSICHVAVRGASNFCIACGHGGHANHMIKWFEAMDICPTGCGCQCLKDSILYWTNT